MNRSPPNLAYWVPSPTWSSMPIFLAIGLGVLNLWGVEFCHCPISRRSPLTQCWRYRSQKEPLLSHESPSRIWEKVGVDIFTFHGHDYLITVDFWATTLKLTDCPQRRFRTWFTFWNSILQGMMYRLLCFLMEHLHAKNSRSSQTVMSLSTIQAPRDSHPRMESRRMLSKY